MIRKLRTDELGRMSVDDYRNAQKIPVTVILEDIRSAMNVGSVFRTSDAFAIERIILCGLTATPPNREINKTAIGATESVLWESATDAAMVIENLKNSGYKILAIEQTDHSVSLNDIEITQNEKIAVIFGNEVEGISETVLSKADICIEIPQFGTKHSLNVSVCAGIVLWELAKKYRI